MTEGTHTGYLLAESLYRTILSMQPSPTAHYALAGALRVSGNVTGSIAEMSEGLAHDSSNLDMLVRLGQLWQVRALTGHGLGLASSAYGIRRRWCVVFSA